MKTTSCMKMYRFIEWFAIKRQLRNTLISLPLAMKYHHGQKRDGGDPYVIHPYRVCITLILLRPEFAFRRAYPKKTERWIWRRCDVLFSTALLHDVLEDVSLPRKGKELVKNYHLEREVLKNIRILTKPPKTKRMFLSSLQTKMYYRKIYHALIPSLAKPADRKDNCRTFGVFDTVRKRKYIIETYEYIYPLCKEAKRKYPEFAQIFDKLMSLIEESIKPYEYLLTG